MTLKFIFRSQVIALVAVIAATIAPLKIGSQLLAMDSEDAIMVYRILSLVAIFFAQFMYIFPLRLFIITNKFVYFIGILTVALLVFMWVTGHDGRLISFDFSRGGGVMSALVFALSVSTIQAFIHVLAANGATKQ